MTVFFSESLAKVMQRWELLDESNKVVTKHFSGATNNYMKLCIEQRCQKSQNVLWYIVVKMM